MVTYIEKGGQRGWRDGSGQKSPWTLGGLCIVSCKTFSVPLERALMPGEVAQRLWPLELQEWPRREYCVPDLPCRQGQTSPEQGGWNVSASDQADVPAQQGNRLGPQA